MSAQIGSILDRQTMTLWQRLHAGGEDQVDIGTVLAFALVALAVGLAIWSAVGVVQAVRRRK